MVYGKVYRMVYKQTQEKFMVYTDEIVYHKARRFVDRRGYA